MNQTLTVSTEDRGRALVSAPAVRCAFEFFETHADEITAAQIALVEIPAPPFGERVRAEYLCAQFEKFNLSDPKIDPEGNVVALRRGKHSHPLLVLTAHLDTVFPEGTNCKVRRRDGKLYAPGISDDGCGLAALVTFARLFDEQKIETKGSLLFVGTVGEEGEGNLRGARYLLSEGEWAKDVDAFISLDGPGIERITHAALGSRRYRVTLAGAGGHSWGDFGTPNPVHAMGRAIARLAAYPTPREPRTTFNVGHVEGGASVNVIPREAKMEVDLRSESAEELSRLDAFFRRAVSDAVSEENNAQVSRHKNGHRQPLHLDMKIIGDRPSGATSKDSSLVRLAEDATRAVGFTPRLECASTDSNIAIARGIPAVTLGTGGTSANIHTLDEWYDPTGRAAGLKRALIVVLGTVGLVSQD
ncbi:MAG: M20/M25/M40 family metallo-hydrolase [Pyrinomonadaceae bacterium]